MSNFVDIQPHEAIYSNRAASYIAIKEFARAKEDCKMAVRLNPDFARTYKRLFKAHLALGHVQEAEQALKTALQKDPNDRANPADTKLMENVSYQHRMVEKFGHNENPDERDYEKCASYCKQIIETCSHSVYHICLKIEMHLLSLQL